MTASAPTLIAEFTNGGVRRPARLTISVLANGRRIFREALPVPGKREARALAAARGAQPWNF